jgi:hypothetical protein
MCKTSSDQQTNWYRNINFVSSVRIFHCYELLIICSFVSTLPLRIETTLVKATISYQICTTVSNFYSVNWIKVPENELHAVEQLFRIYSSRINFAIWKSISIKEIGKIGVGSGSKFVSVHAMRAYKWSRFITSLILNFGTRWTLVVNFTPRPLMSRKEPR